MSTISPSGVVQTGILGTRNDELFTEEFFIEVVTVKPPEPALVVVLIKFLS